jgi:hypothetical protein
VEEGDVANGFMRRLIEITGVKLDGFSFDINYLHLPGLEN